ncbi:MAG: O-antigen ligase family protein [Planctomycetota bacterium]
MNFPGGLLQRLVLGAALLTPLAVDPFGADTQLFKAGVFGLWGVLLLAVGALAVLRNRRRPAVFGAPEWLLLSLIAWSAASAAWAGNPELVVMRVALLLACFGVARVLREAAETGCAARRILQAVVGIGLLAVVIDGAVILFSGEDLHDSEAKHASWVFVHNNMAASFAVALAPLLAALTLGCRRPKTRWLWWGLVVVLLGYLLLLRSRAGLLGTLLVLSVVALLFLLRQRLSRPRPVASRWPAALVTMAVLVAALLPLSESARGVAKDAFFAGVRSFGLDFGDASFRPLLWRKTLTLVREAPGHGVGAGNFVVEFPRVEHNLLAKPHAHNDALQVLAELGLPGLLLFLGLMGALSLRLFRVLRAARSDESFVAAAGLSGLWLALFVSGQFEVPFALPSTLLLFGVLVGLSGALAAESSRAPSAAGSAAAQPIGSVALSTRLAAVGVLGITLPLSWLLVERLPASGLAARAEALALEGRLQEAIEQYQRIADLKTGSPHPWRRMARFELARGDGEAALLAVRTARELWPHSSELIEEEADVLAALGRFDEAVAAFRSCYDAAPANRQVLSKLVRALDSAGQLQAAIDQLEFMVRSDTGGHVDSVRRLMDMWRRRAQECTGAERVEALVAARFFAAVALEEGPAAWWPEINPIYKDLTHQLQIQPGGLSAWWPVFERFLNQGGWNMPYTCLYTSVDGDAKRLFPGWDEPEGPPERGAFRRR